MWFLFSSRSMALMEGLKEAEVDALGSLFLAVCSKLLAAWLKLLGNAIEALVFIDLSGRKAALKPWQGCIDMHCARHIATIRNGEALQEVLRDCCCASEQRPGTTRPAAFRSWPFARSCCVRLHGLGLIFVLHVVLLVLARVSFISGFSECQG